MAVAAGDIAFVALSFDNYNAGAANFQGFAITALAPIAAGDSIRFIDGNLEKSSAFIPRSSGPTTPSR